MASRLTRTAGDRITRATGLPDEAAYTTCMWFYRSVDSGGFEGLVSLGAGDTGPDVRVSMDVTNTDLFRLSHVGSTASAITASTATWYFVAVTCDGSTITGYVSSGLGAISSFTRAFSTAFTPAHHTVGASYPSDTNIISGRLAAVKVWGAVLTQAELERERFCYEPVRRANLNSWIDLHTISRVTDLSGNGNDWACANALNPEEGPPIPYRRGRSRPGPYAVSVGGGGGRIYKLAGTGGGLVGPARGLAAAPCI